MKDLTIIMAFETSERYNRLNESDIFSVVANLTSLAGGATVTEQYGGYVMNGGITALEYSYKFELFGLDESAVKAVTDYFLKLKELHNQESIIINGKFIY